MQSFDANSDAGNEDHNAEHAVEGLENHALIHHVTEDGQDDVDRGKNQSGDPKFGTVHPAVELKEQMTPIHCLPRFAQQ
jgi:hypothetical protein